MKSIKTIKKTIEKTKHMTHLKKPYVMIVELKGKKGTRKIGLSIMEVGGIVQFGGDQRKLFVLKCGKCKKKSTFKIVNYQKFVYECDKCGAYNTPSAVDRPYFEEANY